MFDRLTPALDVAQSRQFLGTPELIRRAGELRCVHERLVVAELSWDTCLESPSPDQQYWDRSRGRRRPGPERLVAEAKIRQIVAPEPRTLLFAAEVPTLAGCLPICPHAG